MLLILLIFVLPLRTCAQDCQPAAKRSEFISKLPGSLSLDEISMLGSHNAGSYSSGNKSIDCLVTNQRGSVLDQLEKGVRYLDIDLCLEGRDLFMCHAASFSSFTFEKLSTVLEQIRCFAHYNSNEVVFLHINRDIRLGVEKHKLPEAAKKLLNELSKHIGHYIFRAGEHLRMHRIFPKLSKLRKARMPVILMLSQYVYDVAPQGLKDMALVDSEFLTIGWLQGIKLKKESGNLSVWHTPKNIVKHACSKVQPFIDFQILHDFAFSVCNRDAARAFRNEGLYQKFYNECMVERKKNNLTVNFVSLDFTEDLDERFIRKIYGIKEDQVSDSFKTDVASRTFLSSLGLCAASLVIVWRESNVLY